MRRRTRSSARAPWPRPAGNPSAERHRSQSAPPRLSPIVYAGRSRGPVSSSLPGTRVDRPQTIGDQTRQAKDNRLEALGGPLAQTAAYWATPLGPLSPRRPDAEVHLAAARDRQEEPTDPPPIHQT